MSCCRAWPSDLPGGFPGNGPRTAGGKVGGTAAPAMPSSIRPVASCSTAPRSSSETPTSPSSSRATARGRSGEDPPPSVLPTHHTPVGNRHNHGGTMTSTTERPARNGVDTPTLFATLDAVKGQNEIAKFQFRASNSWVTGTHSRSTASGFFGAMQEMQHNSETVLEFDHPQVLVGTDHGPTPVQYPLHAIAACLTSGIANVAAARGVDLTKVTSTVEGDIDLLG